MTTPTFPSIGIFISDSSNYKRMPRGTIVRTNMESGPPKQLTIASQAWIESQVTYIFTKTEYQTFLTFYSSTLSNGNYWFNWTDPFDSTTKLARIVNGTITDASPTNPQASYWTVKFTLETVS